MICDLCVNVRGCGMCRCVSVAGVCHGAGLDVGRECHHSATRYVPAAGFCQVATLDMVR